MPATDGTETQPMNHALHVGISPQKRLYVNGFQSRLTKTGTSVRLPFAFWFRGLLNGLIVFPRTV
jgi:hypothetical protein